LWPKIGIGHTLTAQLAVSLHPDPDAPIVEAGQSIKTFYDQIDFGRGSEAFLTGMQATSVYAICQGMDSVGAKRNQGIAINDDLMDARSLFPTPNTTTVYVISCLDLKSGPMVTQDHREY
jgi:hypothetical protein